MTADLASLTGIEVPTGLLIGGEWRPGSAGTLGVTDPATEDTLAESRRRHARGRHRRGRAPRTRRCPAGRPRRRASGRNASAARFEPS